MIDNQELKQEYLRILNNAVKSVPGKFGRMPPTLLVQTLITRETSHAGMGTAIEICKDLGIYEDKSCKEIFKEYRYDRNGFIK